MTLKGSQCRTQILHREGRLGRDRIPRLPNKRGVCFGCPGLRVTRLALTPSSQGPERRGTNGRVLDGGPTRIDVSDGLWYRIIRWVGEQTNKRRRERRQCVQIPAVQRLRSRTPECRCTFCALAFSLRLLSTPTSHTHSAHLWPSLPVLSDPSINLSGVLETTVQTCQWSSIFPPICHFVTAIGSPNSRRVSSRVGATKGLGRWLST